MIYLKVIYGSDFHESLTLFLLFQFYTWIRLLYLFKKKKKDHCWISGGEMRRGKRLNRKYFATIWPRSLKHTFTHRYNRALVLHEHLSGALIDTDVLVIKTVGFDFSTCPLPKKIASALPQRNVPLGLGIKNDFVVFLDYSGIFACVSASAWPAAHDCVWLPFCPACLAAALTEFKS